jgi:LAO/AO transport system kinase
MRQLVSLQHCSAALAGRTDGHGTALDLDKLFAGDRRTLSRCITLIESTREADRNAARALLEAVLHRTGGSFRVAITGAPGVGKSTFIDALGMHLVQRGKRVAVLAVDPSSPIGGGSILGDKTRMERLAKEPSAFIRPSPASDSLGGVAHKTREGLLLCEAAGYDVVIVETVGVGQSEVDVAAMVDFFVILVLPNAGDELQGMKRGIVEFADLIVVNKADGDSAPAAELARAQYQSALRLFGRTREWEPRCLLCSARDQINVDTVWSAAEEYFAAAHRSGRLEAKRAEQNAAWFRKLLRELLERRLREAERIREVLPELELKVTAGEMTPLLAVSRIEQML